MYISFSSLVALSISKLCEVLKNTSHVTKKLEIIGIISPALPGDKMV